MNHEIAMKKFFEATKIPLQLFNSNTRIAHYETRTFEPNPANLILQEALQSSYDVCYTFSPEHLYCGLVRLHGLSEYIIVGPVSPSERSIKQVQSILNGIHLEGDHATNLMHWLNGIPFCDVHRFKGCLKLLDYLINQREDTDVVHVPYQCIVNELPTYKTEPIYIDHMDDNMENEILSYIEYGKVSNLETILSTFTYNIDEIPQGAPSALRSFKNIVHFSTALASRAAIKGGVDYDTAIALTNNYTTHIEYLDNGHDISIFLNQMFLDFARRVAIVRSLPSKSPLVARICKVIYSHLYEKITPTMIAEYLNMNCTYLCTNFKKETGKTITEFVQETKIMESKRLLETTQMTIIEISTQLDFSSQSYFHTVFRKFTGMTPNDFRSKLAP